MKLIELHILQSFPVSCLNRDDVGAPKSAVFGGVNRARISSQCLKRAIRETAKELAPGVFMGDRSRLIIEPLAKAVEAKGVDVERARTLARDAADELSSVDKKREKEGKLQVSTLTFLSPMEIEELGNALAVAAQNEDKPKSLSKLISKAVKSVQLKDAADIAVFGRMVASDHSLTVEGAGMFSHALSVNRVDADIDFFAAVDDLQSRDDSGAGMTGILEFNSACYYRYAALNLDMLFDADHLGALATAERKVIVDAFIRAALTAVPNARKNSMNANTLPSFVRGILREKGHPLQFINAFEKPLRPVSGRSLSETARDAMLEHHDSLTKTWGIEGEIVDIPAKTLDGFCAEMFGHVE